MAIKKATAFTASDGSLCGTLEEAQRAELEIAIFGKERMADGMFNAVRNGDFDVEKLRNAIINSIFAASDEIVEVLTTGPRSRPATRKVKGTTAPKRAADKAAVKAGFKAMRQAVEAGTSTLSSETLDKAEAIADRDADNARDMAAERLRQIPMEAAEG